METCEAALAAAGFSTLVTRTPNGVLVADVPTVVAAAQEYVGSAAQATWAKTNEYGTGLLDRLNADAVQRINLFVMIQGGTVTNLTGAQVGTFLAAVSNNYRTLVAQINAATTVAQVNAINIGAGWPANP